MLRTLASVFVAVAVSLLTALIVAGYWLLLVLLTTLRLLSWPIRWLGNPRRAPPAN